MCFNFSHLTSDFGSYDEWQGDFIWKVFAVWHVRQFSLLQQAHLLPLLSQRCPLLSKECWWTPGWDNKAYCCDNISFKVFVWRKQHYKKYREKTISHTLRWQKWRETWWMKNVCRGTKLKDIPPRFPHQSPDCSPLNPCQLSCFQVGERLLETQAEFIVTLKERSEKENKVNNLIWER